MEDRVVYQGRFIQVTETQVPTGEVFEKAKFRDGISVIIVVKPGVLRFIQEYDRVRDQERIKLVSAYVEDGEDAYDCARRELKEEAGITAEQLELLHCYESRGAIQKNQFFFVISSITEGNANPDVNEMIRGHVDLPFADVQRRALAGDFGRSESAYAILKYVLTH